MHRAGLPFTIALCTCNGETHLGALLQSLRLQSGVAEVVVVDDASTDGTTAILQAVAREDPRFRVVVNPERLGVTRNFEKAIGLARAPWVALADQDDLWAPDKLARIRQAWDGASSLIHHASLKFYGERVPSRVPRRACDRRKFSGSEWPRLLYRNSVVGHTVVVRSTLARRLAPFPRGLLHDWWLGVGAALLDRVQYVDENLVLYRIHSSNAFHCAGSRWRRLRDENAQRLALLDTLADHPAVTGPDRGLIRHYLELLLAARNFEGVLPLWRFYCRQSETFFGRAGPDVRCFRKSLQAALAAMIPPQGAERGQQGLSLGDRRLSFGSARRSIPSIPV